MLAAQPVVSMTALRSAVSNVMWKRFDRQSFLCSKVGCNLANRIQFLTTFTFFERFKSVMIDNHCLPSFKADKVSSAGPQFCQAARHILNTSSSGLRVKVATGGDPVFPVKIHLRGEQVLGSGNGIF